MKGVLIVGHGSRRPTAAQTLEAVADRVRAKLPGLPIQTAHMQFNERDIPAGLEELVRQGAEEIAVVPYFLFDGVHIREDIPQALAAFAQKHPRVKTALGQPLGADERLACLLCDRIRECL